MSDWFPLRLEPRAEPSRLMAYLSPVLAVVLTFTLAGLLVAAMGKSPWQIIQIIALETLADKRVIGELLLRASPMILCALGLCICYRANVWNIGSEGQLVMGGICAGATLIALEPVSMPPFLAISTGVLAGAVGGGGWAAITAFLRQRFHANEILVSYMLTLIAQLLLIYLVGGPLKDPGGMNFPQSKEITESLLLPNLMSGSRLHVGFVVTLVLTGLLTVFLFRSFAGYRLIVGGHAPLAARYAGFSDNAAVWMALLIAGATAGLAGAFEVAGPIGRLMPSISPGYGFSAIIVAFIGRLHPVGAVVGGIIISQLYLGGEMAQSRMGLPASITGVFQGLLLFLLLACDSFIDNRLRLRRA